MTFKHISVLYEASINGLNIKPNGIYIDGTLGGGGHALGILKKMKSGKLIGIDQDQVALDVSAKRLAEYKDMFIVYKSNFCFLKEVLEDLKIDYIDGLLLDLGVSSYQLDTANRGFSYNYDAPLDMRMDSSQNISAYDVINSYTATKLCDVIKDYGEEKWAKRIVEFIVKARSEHTIDTTLQLVDIIKAAVPKGARRDGPHPAKRTFQAIRIEVNNELGIIENTIRIAAEHLNTGGRIAIITFHSLEDRIVKNAFRNLEKTCTCPPRSPVCTCQTVPLLKRINRKPIVPSESELIKNPRARSAKLRIAERV